MVRQRAASLDTLSAKGRMQMRIGDGVPSEQLLPFAEALHASGQGITAEDADESSLVEALRLMRQALGIHERCIGIPGYDVLRHARCIIDVGATLRRMSRWPEARLTLQQAAAMLSEVECTPEEFETSIQPLNREAYDLISEVRAAEALAKMDVASSPVQRFWRAHQRRKSATSTLQTFARRALAGEHFERRRSERHLLAVLGRATAVRRASDRASATAALAEAEAAAAAETAQGKAVADAIAGALDGVVEAYGACESERGGLWTRHRAELVRHPQLRHAMAAVGADLVAGLGALGVVEAEGEGEGGEAAGGGVEQRCAQVRKSLRSIMYVDRRKDWFFVRAYTCVDEESFVYVLVDTGGHVDNNSATSAASRSFTHPLAALSARISNLNKYEFEVTVLKGSGAKQVERFRVETWAMLHAWVNGLTLLSTIARARAQSSSRAV
eukprot:CAMPEP_0185402368 /NCGR_PEP_ID=MMETSP1364-20130426/91761_1 /TAXON_ID=38817 /ORGANISM="Gephyrocapsa oceanica, Strain RCC1303" /LENGTH=442 /DNA_ID=CAMNT_0028004665 /DNA_START=131 /DNA_END=1459 /DNA_ORIENTATION=+